MVGSGSWDVEKGVGEVRMLERKIGGQEQERMNEKENISVL